MMDTYTQAITVERRHRGLEEKRRIVEETLAEGASVALIARTHGVNANPVFHWRRQYQSGRLGTSLVFLAVLGGLGARAGGAPVTVGALRVTFWGALAMLVTAGVGALFGTVA